MVFKRDPQGQVKVIIGTAQDITQRKQAEFQLQQTNAELTRATRLKDEFLANMSHELRTPLNAILGLAQGFQQEIFNSVTPRQLKAIGTIERSGRHLLSLINDILDLSKIEAGQLTLDYSTIQVSTLCKMSLAFVKQQAFQKKLRLITQIPEDIPPLVADDRRINQVLINLLSNAVKFTPEGGHVTLEVSYLAPSSPQDQPALRFAVTDTGIGIRAEDQAKLFRPFQQIDSTLNRQYEGTGLGLALVKNIVELHRGTVSLTSEVGVGSCFAFTLPLGNGLIEPLEEKDFNESDDVILAAPLSPESETAPLILLAEDNEANIMMLSSYLVAKGYRVCVAENGRQTVNLTKIEYPDLILMDIQMPEIDGLEAIRLIRQDPDVANIPIIALTALAMPGDRDRCLTAGADDYLTKPIKLTSLKTTIQKHLKKN